MKCKIFHATNGFLNTKLGEPVTYLEDAINNFLKLNKITRTAIILQSQSCVSTDTMKHHGQTTIYTTTSIFY